MARFRGLWIGALGRHRLFFVISDLKNPEQLGKLKNFSHGGIQTKQDKPRAYVARRLETFDQGRYARAVRVANLIKVQHDTRRAQFPKFAQKSLPQFRRCRQIDISRNIENCRFFQVSYRDLQHALLQDPFAVSAACRNLTMRTWLRPHFRRNSTVSMLSRMKCKPRPPGRTSSSFRPQSFSRSTVMPRSSSTISRAGCCRPSRAT